MTRSTDADQYRRLYKTKAWATLRRHVLIRDGYICQQTGVLLRPGRTHPNSAVVHHRTPHKGDRALFYDPGNCEAVSKAWHDSQAQSEERLGYSTAIGEDGWPTCPNHPFNRILVVGFLVAETGGRISGGGFFGGGFWW